MKKSFFLIGSILVLIICLSVSYAWFSYNKVGNNNKLIAGDIYLHLEEGTDEILLTNVFPETKEEARARDDNYITFTVDGFNSNDEAIYYELLLKNGEDRDDPYERFNDHDLVFDLVEIGENNEETYLLDAVSFETINNRRIWVDTVLDSDGTVERTYRLRMWLSDTVIISDTEASSSYPATGDHAYSYRYARAKVAIYGDLKEKSYPLTFNLTEDLNKFDLYLANDYLDSEIGNNANDNLELRISSTDSNVKFNYSYENLLSSVEDEDTYETITETNLSNVSLNFNYSQNETKEISVIIKGASISGSDIIFEVIKNGLSVEKFTRTMYKLHNDKNIMGLFPESINNVNLKSTVTSIEFVNVSKNMLESDYDLENPNVYDLTIVEDNEKLGDVRAKLSGTVLTVASSGKTYLSIGENLFSEFTELTTLDFTNIDTRLVTSMHGMFRKSNKITSLDLSMFNTSSVVDMTSMFSAGGGSNRNSLTSINMSNFDTGKVRSMYAMFFGCSNLSTLNVTNFNTENVTNMQSMFSQCRGLTELDISNFKTSKVKKLYRMFYYCTNLITIKVSNLWSNVSVYSGNEVFKGSTKLVGGDGTTYSSDNINSTYARIDNPPDEPGYFTYKAASTS